MPLKEMVQKRTICFFFYRGEPEKKGKKIMQSAISMLAALEERCFTHNPYHADHIKSVLSDPAYLVLTIDSDGSFGNTESATKETLTSHPVGYLIAYRNHSEGLSELYRIAVLPEHRQKGLARRLLTEWIRRSSGLRLILEVASKNTAAITLYQQSGFTMIARRKRYYSDGDDALIFERIP
jgi:ribosomal-protein-alanine N-acetyltransferase